MSLIYDKRELASKYMWAYAGQSKRARDEHVFEGNGGYRLMTSDIARAASIDYDSDTMTVAEYQELLKEHTEQMTMLYNRFKNHPNFQYEFYMSIYEKDGSLNRKGLVKPFLVGHYHYSNMMYDQLLSTKIEQCLDKGYIRSSDLMSDAQKVIEPNLIPIGDIKWDDFEVYDYLNSHEKAAYANIKDNVYSYRSFQYKGLTLTVAEHNENLKLLFEEAMDSLEPYQLQPTENYNDVKRAFNRRYYDVLDEDVVPLNVDDDLRLPRRINIALDGILDQHHAGGPVRRKDSFILE